MESYAIDYWMSNGFRIPGWIIVRPELSLDAKVLYGFLLDEIDIWLGQRGQVGFSDSMYPLWKPPEVAKMLQWDPCRLADARDELFKHKLFFLLKPISEDLGYRRYCMESRHPWWVEGCFRPVSKESESGA